MTEHNEPVQESPQEQQPQLIEPKAVDSPQEQTLTSYIFEEAELEIAKSICEEGRGWMQNNGVHTAKLGDVVLDEERRQITFQAPPKISENVLVKPYNKKHFESQAQYSVACIESVLRQLKEAHAAGIVHGMIRGDLMTVRRGSLSSRDSTVLFILPQPALLMQLPSFMKNEENTKDLVAYLAPEQQDEYKKTPQSDLWQVGLLWHMLLTGKHAFGEQEVAKNIKEGQIVDALPEDVPAEIKELISKLLSVDPAARPELQAVLGSDIFKPKQKPEPVRPARQPARKSLAQWRSERQEALSEEEVVKVARALLREAERIGKSRRCIAGLEQVEVSEGSFSLKVNPLKQPLSEIRKDPKLACLMCPELLSNERREENGQTAWAIGLQLAWLITGSNPFAADTLEELSAKICAKELHIELAAAPTKQLAEFVMFLLNKRPSVQEIRESMLQFSDKDQLYSMYTKKVGEYATLQKAEHELKAQLKEMQYHLNEAEKAQKHAEAQEASLREDKARLEAQVASLKKLLNEADDNIGRKIRYIEQQTAELKELRELKGSAAQMKKDQAALTQKLMDERQTVAQQTAEIARLKMNLQDNDLQKVRMQLEEQSRVIKQLQEERLAAPKEEPKRQPKKASKEEIVILEDKVQPQKPQRFQGKAEVRFVEAVKTQDWDTVKQIMENPKLCQYLDEESRFLGRALLKPCICDGVSSHIILAAVKGCPACCRKYLQRALITKEKDTERRAIHFAAENNFTECVAILATCEARVKDAKGETALMVAAKLGLTDVVKILAKEEAGEYNKEGLTALIIAAQSGNLDVVNELRAAEARLCNTNDETALMMAVRKNHAEIAKVLLADEAGLKNKAGKCALSIAITEWKPECIKVLWKTVQERQYVSEYEASIVSKKLGLK